MMWLRIVLACVLAHYVCGARTPGRRAMTEAETRRCGDEVAAVVALGVPHAVARTVNGFSLAVYNVTSPATASSASGSDADTGTDATLDPFSAALLTSGTWEGSLSTRALEHAAATMGKAPPSYKACAAPPCLQNVAVDVGAKLGWWAFTAAARGWKAIAIEAAPTNVALMRLSLCLNRELAPLINIQHKMVGTHKGSCALALPRTNLGDGFMQCTLHGKHVEWTAAELAELMSSSSSSPLAVSRAFRMEVSLLDDVLDDVWEADAKLPHAAAFTKLDLSGSEPAALNGTLTWLQRGRLPYLHTEVWRTVAGGVPPFLHLLHRFDYTLAQGSCLNPSLIERGIGVKLFTQTMRRVVDICATLPFPED